MPNIFNFANLKNVKTVEVSPEGWISPLYVEYGITNEESVYGIPTCCWRVKGTLHTFTIPLIRLDYLSSGDYKTHFNEVLNTFRQDYITWNTEGFITQWAREYYEQYHRFIVI
jgi:hypothetical protein